MRLRVDQVRQAQRFRREPVSEIEPADDVRHQHAERGLACSYAGHEWADAGGGLLICALCEAEEWDDE
jgi:hypothetical protein